MTRAVHPNTVTTLDAYLTHRAATAGIEVDQLSGPLLVTTSGAPGPAAPCSDWSAASLGPPNSPRAGSCPRSQLRHSFATMGLAMTAFHFLTRDP